MPLEFVNYQGDKLPDPVALKKYAARKVVKPEEKSFHKGWKVVGVPPGALEEAREAHHRLQDMAAKAGGKEIKPFDPAAYLQNHKGKAVRSKPYEIESSAKDCAALAEKNGWTRVRIEEVKRDIRKPSSAAFA